jgi:hypothetical protein
MIAYTSTEANREVSQKIKKTSIHLDRGVARPGQVVGDQQAFR